ncbi:MAG TPA: dTDP-4-dehydrorhamnose 3,5-epimerase [Candidatus Acidoferrales bacterium]|nr:dTDP-4-dehydrorhamnose 3,5-epimerase [Candidatus Acidoferrales bacterium]
MPFLFTQLEIPDVLLVAPKVFLDARGFFAELYKRSDFERNGVSYTFVQDNYSHSTRGVLRGLHYQMAPMAQGKLVSVIRGEIFDVAVDIRRGSPTFGRWVAATLSDRNHQLLFVPGGFAHGFCVVSDEADVVYKVTAEYAPECDRGIRWDDPDIGIGWPLPTPVLSEKDASLPWLRDADNNFSYANALPVAVKAAPSLAHTP